MCYTCFTPTVYEFKAGIVPPTYLSVPTGAKLISPQWGVKCDTTVSSCLTFMCGCKSMECIFSSVLNRGYWHSSAGRDKVCIYKQHRTDSTCATVSVYKIPGARWMWVVWMWFRIAGLLWFLSHLRIAGYYLLSVVTSSCFVSHRGLSNYLSSGSLRKYQHKRQSKELKQYLSWTTIHIDTYRMA